KYPKNKAIADIFSLKEGEQISTAGRITSIRTMGKITFCHISDISGKIQIVIQEDTIGKDVYKQF
ncbi:MAG TPA: lysine--tRNA ligase, partial [Candidatus Jacksonbacteria bacterium]|nr:lysine--tRNA ligase [Candidatus Jacksonbacteria bacterium]